MRSAPLLGAAVSLCLVVAPACAGNDEQSEAEIEAQLREALREGDSTLDDDAAECFAELVIDEIGLAELRDVDMSAEIPEELEDEVAAAAVKAVDECEANG